MTLLRTVKEDGVKRSSLETDFDWRRVKVVLVQSQPGRWAGWEEASKCVFVLSTRTRLTVDDTRCGQTGLLRAVERIGASMETLVLPPKNERKPVAETSKKTKSTKTKKNAQTIKNQEIAATLENDELRLDVIVRPVRVFRASYADPRHRQLRWAAWSVASWRSFASALRAKASRRRSGWTGLGPNVRGCRGKSARRIRASVGLHKRSVRALPRTGTG